jgi:hypothetical protein
VGLLVIRRFGDGVGFFVANRRIVGLGVGFGVGLGVGFGAGLGVGFGVGLRVGFGCSSSVQ